MNRNFVQVRRHTRRLSVVLPILIEDLLEAVRVDGADLSTVCLTGTVHLLHRVVDVLVVTGLDGADHVLLLVEDRCGDGKTGNARPGYPVYHWCVIAWLVLGAVASRVRPAIAAITAA